MGISVKSGEVTQGGCCCRISHTRVHMGEEMGGEAICGRDRRGRNREVDCRRSERLVSVVTD